MSEADFNLFQRLENQPVNLFDNGAAIRLDAWAEYGSAVIVGQGRHCFGIQLIRGPVEIDNQAGCIGP